MRKLLLSCCGLLILLNTGLGFCDQPGIFVRFNMLEPTKATYYVQIGAIIHSSPWGLGSTIWPAQANTSVARRIKSGEYTPWFNLRDLETKDGKLHGRLGRSGGIAEFPNITLQIFSDPPSLTRKIGIDLATAPDELYLVKRFEESFTGTTTSFLVSPDLDKDCGDLETASQMTERHLLWAKEASGGKAIGPKKLSLMTGFWGPQRPELNVKEAEVLRFLGFNVLSGQQPEVLSTNNFDAFCLVGADASPALTREGQQKYFEQYVKYTQPLGKRLRQVSFNDEIGVVPLTEPGKPIAPETLANFRNWLVERKISPDFLGVKNLSEVNPMGLPGQDGMVANLTDRFTRRLYYLSCRFRQESTTERYRWASDAAHQALGSQVITHTMPADHPFLAGVGMGFARTGNWGDFLSCDWFDLARRQSTDSLGIEDWLGLQYMYGPGYTWEGFQLLSFMTNIIQSGARSAGRDEMPMMAWITPSDKTNLLLKTTSCLAQGCKNFYLWIYGPTCTSTENYWSDLRSEYDGIATLARFLGQGEELLLPGRLRPTRLALLYSISSDLWQPFGYVSQLERRMTYFSLLHDQYPVNLLAEEDIVSGRLANYDALYLTDPCISKGAAEKIAEWVRQGGHLYGACAAGLRDEYNEPTNQLSEVFGLESNMTVNNLPGNYGRGGLNHTEFSDFIQLKDEGIDSSFGVLGIKAGIKPRAAAKIIGTFKNGDPAVVENHYGKGITRYFATCPAISYLKDAHFVRNLLKEKWPSLQRRLINHIARRAEVQRPVEISSPIVETGLYDSPRGLVLVLANYTYQPIKALEVRVKQAKSVRSVFSVEKGKVPFSLEKDGTCRFRVSLGISDLILLRK